MPTDNEDEDVTHHPSHHGNVGRRSKRSHDGEIVTHTNFSDDTKASNTNPTISHNDSNDGKKSPHTVEEFSADYKKGTCSESGKDRSKVPKLILHFSSLDDGGEVSLIKKLRKNFSCPIAGFFCNNIFEKYFFLSQIYMFYFTVFHVVTSTFNNHQQITYQHFFF